MEDSWQQGIIVNGSDVKVKVCETCDVIVLMMTIIF